MNKVADILRGEHQLIARAASCLEHIAHEALDDEQLSVVGAIDLLEFFTDFADAAHQDKEERYVFPALLRRGVVGHGVMDLIEDHEHETEVLRSMGMHLQEASNGDPSRREEFARCALEYAAEQREHVEEENRILLPMVEMLSDHDTELEVLAGFRETDAHLARKTTRDYALLVERVEERIAAPVWAPDRGSRTAS